MGGGSHGSLPPIRAVRASSQASRAAGASAVSPTDAPPVGAWKCRRGGGGQGCVCAEVAVGSQMVERHSRGIGWVLCQMWYPTLFYVFGNIYNGVYY